MKRAGKKDIAGKSKNGRSMKLLKDFVRQCSHTQTITILQRLHCLKNIITIEFLWWVCSCISTEYYSTW